MTPDTLAAAIGCPREQAELYAGPLAEACARYAINTPARLAAFLAQIGHESGSLRYTAELWGPTPAQARYEGRADLGNTQPGDGRRFKGHGLIQTTGRYNHARTRDALADLGCPDFEADPEALTLPRWAALSAAWYWQSHGCNELADAGDFEAITRKINGGLNGHDDRLRRWERAKAVLMLAPDEPSPQAAPQPQQTQVTQPPKEPAMLPLIPLLGAILPTLAQNIPALGKLFGSGSEVSERNVKAASLAVDIVQQAVGASNAQQAAEIVAADPMMAKAANDAVEASRTEISAAFGAAEAHAAELAFIATGAKPWDSTSFWAMVILVPLVYIVTLSLVGVVGNAEWAAEMRASIATMIVSLILGGVGGYYFGSATSRNRPPGAK